jgi:acylphosphatase
LIQKKVIVSGRVQGVSFRASTAEAALHYPSLKGYVRNLPDGTVEAVFQGTPSEVNAMVEWCRRGPTHAQVTGLEIQDEEPDSGLVGRFEIRR